MSEQIDIEAMRKKRDELWQAYMDGPGGQVEAFRQGRFEGYDMALRQVLAPSTAPLTPEQRPADHGDGSGAGGRSGGEGA